MQASRQTLNCVCAYTALLYVGQSVIQKQLVLLPHITDRLYIVCIFNPVWECQNFWTHINLNLYYLFRAVIFPVSLIGTLQCNCCFICGNWTLKYHAENPSLSSLQLLPDKSDLVFPAAAVHSEDVDIDSVWWRWAFRWRGGCSYTATTAVLLFGNLAAFLCSFLLLSCSSAPWGILFTLPHLSKFLCSSIQPPVPSFFQFFHLSSPPRWKVQRLLGTWCAAGAL